jgi:hypothetical protein
MSLATVDGNAIGYIKIFLSKESEKDSDMQEQWMGQLLEIVELAKGHRRGKDGEVEHYYHVMWVEWEKGFACRKGLGKVDLQGWNMLELDHFNLTLG